MSQSGLSGPGLTQPRLSGPGLSQPGLSGTGLSQPVYIEPRSTQVEFVQVDWA